MSHYFRKFGRNSSRGSGPSEADNPDTSLQLSREKSSDDTAIDHHEHRQVPRPRGQRHGSEPTEQILSSLPQRFRDERTVTFQSKGFRVPTSTDPELSSTIQAEGGRSSEDSLGLILHHCPTSPNADFIFVHGLGGSSQRTWSFKRDLKNFWPTWLSREPSLSNARIFTFGYNANFRGPNNTLNITDFAKDLLFRMLTFTTSAPTGPKIGIGQHPIFFVAHSMGGLVTKKAYTLGKHEQDYAAIISQVHGIIFLATPHRGSNYAHTLNQILVASPFGTSRKEYIAQLEATSSTIQDINEHFRTLCSDLQLVSFYETIKTSLAKGVKRMIVEKTSATLDYPQEKSSPLNADHHTICKYESPSDENYLDVKNMIQLMVSRLPLSSKVRPSPELSRKIPQGVTSENTHRRPSTVEMTKRLQDILGVHEDPETDYRTQKSRMLEGSCQWMLRKPILRQWIHGSDADPRILWLLGPPATGKSILTSFMIDWLKNSALEEGGCQHFFFHSDHQTKRTISYFLRMMAFQLAQSHDVIQDAIFRLNTETNITFDQQSAASIWEKVFEGIIFRAYLSSEIVWALDGLDEAESPVSLVEMLCKIRSSTPIKLFITSRETKDYTSFINSCPERILSQKMSLKDTASDIEDYVTRTIRASLPSGRERQNELIQEVLTKASGSFLWVKLILDTVRDSWHTEADLRRAMLEVPVGMEPLYRRMLKSVVQQTDRNRLISMEILTWAVCSFRPLQLSELQAALLPKFEGFVSLKDTINQICGHFIDVHDGQITMVHATARQFLLFDIESPISNSEGHKYLALSCLDYLSNERWKDIFALGPTSVSDADRKGKMGLTPYAVDHPRLPYTIEHWAYHVSNASFESAELWKFLDDFFSHYFLAWVYAVALSANLRILIRTAQYLRVFIHKKAQSKIDIIKPSQSLGFQDAQWLRGWTIDLIRIVGKFGKILLQDPAAIYRLIPIFCPPESQIGSIYGTRGDSTLTLSGLSSASWDDCLTKISTGDDSTISRILATEACFVTLMSSRGIAVVFSAETLEQLCRINHGEYVTHMAADKLGTTLITAGIRSFRTWEICSGKQIDQISRNSEARTITIVLNESRSVIVGREDYSVQCVDLSTGEIRWTSWALGPQHPPKNCPRLMVISPDNSKIAVAERGRPVLIWNLGLSDIQQPWRCIRSEDFSRDLEDQEAWNAPEVVCWHPDGTSIFILYQDTTIVHWNFPFDEQKECGITDAREMVISKDGNFLLTSGANGTLSVWGLPRFHLLYRLFFEELVRDLTFSPDGQRIYDSRGSICNVWEPDVLTRHEEVWRDDASSSYEEAEYSDPVISQDDNSRSQITALVCDQTDKYFSCGRDDGTVFIHDATTGKSVRKVYGHSTAVSIIALEWSKSGRFIASGDDSGRVICKRLESKGLGRWAVFPMFDIRLADSVRQFLFHPTESLLLISTEATDTVWELKLKDRKQLVHKSWPRYPGRRWAAHPLDPTKLLWFDSDSTGVHEWHSLERCDSPTQQTTQSDIESSRPHLSTTPSGTPESVRGVSVARNGRYIVCETLQERVDAGSPLLHSLRAQMILADPKIQDKRFRYSSNRTVLEELSAFSTRIIGVYRNRVIFLDRSFWVCSCELGLSVRSLKKHFFLPQDWISRSSLELLRCNEQCTFFCPKNGEVAIVRNGFRL